MKKNLLFSMIVCMVASFVFSSCSAPDRVEGPQRVAIVTTVPNGGARMAAKGGDIVISIVANPGLEWTLSCNVDWVSFDITEGVATTPEIPATVKPNETGAQRVAILTAQGDGLDPITYKITQLK